MDPGPDPAAVFSMVPALVSIPIAIFNYDDSITDEFGLIPSGHE
jgi:hypothetical protein